MARALGDLTPKVEDVQVADETTFGWFGAEVRIAYDFGELVFTDWVEEFGSLAETDPRSIASVKHLMRRSIHPDDFDEFWRLAVAHRQTSEDLAGLFARIIEVMADRPTVQPSDSSAGPTRATLSSVGGSSQRVIDRFEAAGRPDLALLVERAQEQLSG